MVPFLCLRDERGVLRAAGHAAQHAQLATSSRPLVPSIYNRDGHPGGPETKAVTLFHPNRWEAAPATGCETDVQSEPWLSCQRASRAGSA